MATVPLRRRLAVARFWYEGNAFCPITAGLADFERREWRRGDAALAAAHGTATEMAAVGDFVQAHSDWDVVVSRCAGAMPSGPAEEGVFAAFLAEVLADLAGQRWDAIYLSLHGASITTERDAPELDLLAALRAQHPDVPIAASFDLHANHAPALAPLLSIACGYQTYPHVDLRETAARTLALLERVVYGAVRPVGVIRNEGLFLSSANMRTGAGPMATLQALARAQVQPPVLDVSVYGGFAYADSSHIGASVMAWADGDTGAARRAVDTVYAALEQLAPDFDVPLRSPEDGIRLALQTPGLVAVTDPADNPMSGGIADTPGLLRALLATPLAGRAVFASLADHDVVGSAWAAGVGAKLDVRLGGRRSVLYGAPVAVSCEVEGLTEGVFRNTGPMERGAEIRCGRTAMLRVGALSLIVTEYIASCDDPAFLAMHGIDLARIRLLCVKAKNHFRGAFGTLCQAIVEVDAPGPATLNLASLPLKRRRPGRAAQDVPPE